MEQPNKPSYTPGEGGVSQAALDSHPPSPGLRDTPTQKLARGDALALAHFPARRDGGDGQEINREAALALIRWGEKYNLDPWAGQLCYMYGSPYVTEQGAVAHARRQREYGGYFTRPVPFKERPLLGIPDDAWAMECHVAVKGDAQPVVEYGIVTKEEVAQAEARYKEKASFLPLVRAPFKVALARAVRRAHLRAFPIEGQQEPSEKAAT